MHYISDSYGETQAGFDLMNQTNGNFAYDLIGNLVKDKAMQVSSMSWTAYHKREKVVKEDGTTITYRYDAMNNRIYKKAEGNGVTETTHYLRDGTGNTLAIYKNGVLEELNIYGSSRIGTYNGKTDKGKRTLGNKRYELSNHLGNALVVITDNKIGIDSDADFIADTYIALVVSERDYLAFGAVMAGRSVENEDYTYSFNGKELDKATGWQDYGFRDYNPVYKRFDMVDPLTQKYPELTPYQFASNTPIMAIDLDGLEAWEVTKTAWTASDVKGFNDFASKEFDRMVAQAKTDGKPTRQNSLDCADLAIVLFIKYAADNGLPVTFTSQHHKGKGYVLDPSKEKYIAGYRGGDNRNPPIMRTFDKKDKDKALNQFIEAARQHTSAQSLITKRDLIPVSLDEIVKEGTYGIVANSGYHVQTIVGTQPNSQGEYDYVASSSSTNDLQAICLADAFRSTLNIEGDGYKDILFTYKEMHKSNLIEEPKKSRTRTGGSGMGSMFMDNFEKGLGLDIDTNTK